MSTFGDIWRRVRLYIPDAPVLLVQAWVRDAYRELADQRGWGWLTIENQLVFGDARTLTVVTTLNSTTVTSAGLFVASDAGRQFRVGSFPIYTIAAFVDANTITLDRTYQTTGVGAVTGEILDAYATMPIDFGRFVVVVDPVNQRMVPWWATQEELDLIDPTRQATEGTPRLLAARRPSTFSGSLGQIQYEYWPKPTAAGALQYYAVKRPVPTSDDEEFVGVLRDRSDILEIGALAKAAMWPGTHERPNPYFNLGLANQLSGKFQALSTQLDLRDDDQYQQSWSTIPWHRWSTWSWAYDTHLLQATDATLASYWGGQWNSFY